MSETARPVALGVPTGRRSGLGGRLLDLIPLGLAIVAEAAWISVAGGLIAEFTLQEPQLDIGALAVFVIAGVVAARFLAPAAGPRWPSIALFLVACGGLVGWLSAPAARAALVTYGVFPALGINVAGWVAGIAVLRGFAHAKLPVSAGTLGTVFAVGVPSLAIAALAGGMIAEPHRGRFLADALVAVVLFAGAATLALAIARLTAIGAGSGFDWRRNPTWVGLLVVLVLTTLAVAVPAAGASPLIALAAGAAVGPLLIVCLVIGFDRGTIRTIAYVALGAILVFALLRFIGGSSFQVTLLPGGSTGGQTETPGAGPAAPIALIGVLVAAVILVLILASLWARRTTRQTGDPDEVRLIDHGEDAETERPRRWRLGRGRGGAPDPRGAVDAYVRLLADIDRRPAVRREPAESPAAHAARLRAAGDAHFSLDLLAADYALARFGGVDLSPAEERRAVGRWRRLRRTLGVPGPPSPGDGPAAGR